MFSVLRRHHVVQAGALLMCGLMVAILPGCQPPGPSQPSPATSVKATPPVEETAPAEELPPPTEVPAEPQPEETPAEEEPPEEKPAEEKPSEEEPADEEPAEEKPAEEKPAEEKPAEEKPAEEKPVEEEPAEEEAAEEEPAEEEPAEEEAAEEKPAEEAAAEEEKFDPTYVVTVEWLPEPIENPDAEAETEADMKPYKEEIAATDASFEMIPIPGGKFTMGSADDEDDRKEDEGPQHEVEIEPFWMGKFEVTWDEYEQYGLGIDAERREMKLRQAHPGVKDKELQELKSDREKLVDAITRPTKPYTDMTFGFGKEGYPAICMSQLAARGYCKWLAAKTGRYYRLPTEAEWEYACRAGTTTAYSFGDDPDELDDYGWYFDNSDDQYQKVGQKKPNPWGLYDVHGNACEWVLDGYFADYYKQFAGKPTKCPLALPKERDPRVARGGCWDDDPEKLRSAARFPSHADWRMQDPQIPLSIWYNTEVYCPGIRLVRPQKVPDVEEARLYEWDYEAIKEYKEAQAGKE